MGSLRLLLLNRSVHGIKQAMGFSAGQTDGPDGAERERKICDQSNDMNNPSGFDIVVSYSGRGGKICRLRSSSKAHNPLVPAVKKATHAIKLRFSSRRSNNLADVKEVHKRAIVIHHMETFLLSICHIGASPTFFYASRLSGHDASLFIISPFDIEEENISPRSGGLRRVQRASATPSHR